MNLMFVLSALVLFLHFPPNTLTKTQLRILRYVNPDGEPVRTVVLPPGARTPDNYVLVSSSAVKEGEGPPRITRRWKKKNNSTFPPLSSPLLAPHPPTPTLIHQPSKLAKLLSLFTVVKFSNDRCSEAGTTCYHRLECLQQGGTPRSQCASGFGVCCLLESSCDKESSSKSALFTGGLNPGLCRFTIHKTPCTRQIRLDFLQLQLNPPENGNCISENLIVSGINRNQRVPVLCGYNTGQHIYLGVEESSGPVSISVNSGGGKPFRIQIQQICPNEELEAPRDCLQYYPAPHGSIQSFNYQQTFNSTYLNNLNYAACIRKEPGSCSILYTNIGPGGTEFLFEINNIDPVDSALTVPPGQSGAEIINCPDDYVSIAGVRLCGQKLNDASLQADFTRNSPIIDSSQGPFMILVRTNSEIVGRGFHINYQQRPC